MSDSDEDWRVITDRLHQLGGAIREIHSEAIDLSYERPATTATRERVFVEKLSRLGTLHAEILAALSRVLPLGRNRKSGGGG